MQRVAHSYELYPPRSAAAAAAMPAAIDALAASGPEFFSITYGAGGSATAASFDLAALVAARTEVEVMAHLTCGGLAAEDAPVLVRRFLEAGVRRFLALRGDLVDGDDGGGLRSAAELVRLVHEAHGGSSGVQVAVAAFVNGYPGARGGRAHLDALLAKQAAGAALAITQLFFRAEDYARFVRRARQEGVVIPIVPGVMPVTSPARLARTLELSGEDPPAALAAALGAEPTPEGRHEIGVAHATGLAAHLLQAGAPALHLYTFNRADAVLDVLRRLGHDRLDTDHPQETT